MSTASSFTQRLLAELAPHPPRTPCCRTALIEGMVLASGDPISTTRLVSARAALQVLHEAGIDAHVSRVAAPRRVRYVVAVAPDAAAPAPSSARPCCTRSRLRGAFMAAGRANHPDSEPHVEVDVASPGGAERLLADAARLGIVAVAAARRGRIVLRVRGGDGVAAWLSTIGAQSGRLEFEEGRVVHEVRGNVNRRLNAETANLGRTVAAGVTQIEAVAALRARGAWESLPAALREAADLRERHPSESLDVLARAAGCSRSAMAGRLHRLVALAAG